jgi:hypothetical protein
MLVLSFVIYKTCTQRRNDRKKLPQFRHRLPPHQAFCMLSIAQNNLGRTDRQIWCRAVQGYTFCKCKLAIHPCHLTMYVFLVCVNYKILGGSHCRWEHLYGLCDIVTRLCVSEWDTCARMWADTLNLVSSLPSFCTRSSPFLLLPSGFSYLPYFICSILFLCIYKQDLKFSQWCCWRFNCSGMLHYVDS